MLRIDIDRDKCVGSGNCVFWAPGTFDLDSEGLSVVVDPSGDAEDRVRVAADGCPSKAITVVSVDGPTPENRREETSADRHLR
jgi:ferredoxin